MQNVNELKERNASHNYSQCRVLYWFLLVQLFLISIIFIILAMTMENFEQKLLFDTYLIEGIFLMWSGLSLFFLGWHYEKRGESRGFGGFIARHRKYALLLGIPLLVEVVRVLIGVL